MISVIIPALNAEATLPATLSALVTATVDGLVRQVIVADGGSTDRTLDIADKTGADIVRCVPGRGQQMRAGATQARFPWLFFLHADTVPGPGWQHEVQAVLHRGSGETDEAAFAFRFALDAAGFAPRCLERLVAWRCALFGLPYGDQGLLISRRLYDKTGGFAPVPLMEDVDFLRRLGRHRVRMLATPALTSAARYRRNGYILRPLRNQLCLALFLAGAPMATIVRLYGLDERKSADRSQVRLPLSQKGGGA